MTAESTEAALRNRCMRWLLLLTFIHTIPAPWLTPVSGGTAPVLFFFAAALIALPNLVLESAAFVLLALVPGLVYLGIGWLIARAVTRVIGRFRRGVRPILLAVIVVPLLLIVYQPIYVLGGHSGSSNYDLSVLLERSGTQISIDSAKQYMLAVYAVLAVLFAAQLVGENHPVFSAAERVRKPALAALVLAMLAGIGYLGHPLFICRPLAGLGVSSAQVCVARVGGTQASEWYERAANQGNLEAINWMAGHSRGSQKLLWIRMGAEGGDAALQYQLYRRQLSSSKSAEAEEWLNRAAENGHHPALRAVIARLYGAAIQAKSADHLDEYKLQLQRAAAHGLRDAKFQLARHYSDGGMGYPADLAQARMIYRDLRDNGKPSKSELRLGHDVAFYAARIDELDSWSLGIKSHDVSVMKMLAGRYLRSSLPGQGVRELGTRLLQQLAGTGDPEAREQLMLGLRTGSGGIEQNLDAAKGMQLSAAANGDLDEMERVRANYFSGQQGYPLDYAESRRWSEELLEIYQGRTDKHALARVHQLKSDLAFIDRIGKQAGGSLLSEPELEQLKVNSDAQSQYEFAVQLLAGKETSRRTEAIARLNQASSLGHGDASWRLVQIYERGFPPEINQSAALQQLRLAVENHQFDASKELAFRYERGNKGVSRNLPKAIALYEETLAAADDNRYNWNLDHNDYNHYAWLRSRLKQAKSKYKAQLASSK